MNISFFGGAGGISWDIPELMWPERSKPIHRAANVRAIAYCLQLWPVGLSR